MNRKTRYTGMRRLNGCLLAAFLLLGACSGEESVGDFLQGNIPICFNGDIPKTKAVKKYIGTTDLTDIGVFAYFTHGDFNENTSTPNFMYNQPVKKQTDGTWFYSPVKFWPDNKTADKISFFAYAPYVNESENSTFSFQDKKTTSGFPVLSYTVPTTEYKQIDFLAATPIMNQNNGNVSFRLHHTLTKIDIYIKSNDNTEGKYVTFFSITGTKSGTLTYYAPAIDNDKGWKWIYSSSKEKETFIANITNFSIPNTISEKKKLLATFFLLPDGEGSKFNIIYQYMAKDKNNNSIIQTINLKDQSLPSTNSWNPGASVNYTIGIAKKAITVMPENDPAPWEGDADTETVNGTEEKQETN